MGRKGADPTESRTRVANIPVDNPTAPCPLTAKGTIKVVVLVAGTNDPVKGAVVSISGGPKSGSKKTSGSGEAIFKKMDPGGYAYVVDLAPAKLLWPSIESANGATSVEANGVRTVTIYVDLLGSAVIEVREWRDNAAQGLLPDAEVISIKLSARSVVQEANVARLRVEKVKANTHGVTIDLEPTKWVLKPNQTLQIDVEAGKEKVFPFYAVAQKWLHESLVELAGNPEIESPISGATLALKNGATAVTLVTDALGGKREPLVNAQGDTFDILSVKIDGDDVIYWAEDHA